MVDHASVSVAVERKPLRVLLVEDHVVVRSALRVLLERTGDMEAIDEAGTSADALERVRARPPDVAVIDIKLPDRNGVDLCRSIRVVSPNTRLLLLSAIQDEETLLSAMVEGADGYLNKTTSPEELFRAIRTVATGKPYFGVESTGTFLSVMRARVLSLQRFSMPLSPQELRVVALVAEGKTNKEIAVALSLSEKTVKNYLSHAYDKLQVSNRAEATAVYCRLLACTTLSSQGL